VAGKSLDAVKTSHEAESTLRGQGSKTRPPMLAQGPRIRPSSCAQGLLRLAQGCSGSAQVLLRAVQGCSLSAHVKAAAAYVGGCKWNWGKILCPIKGAFITRFVGRRFFSPISSKSSCNRSLAILS
jgi:hypothetical protein